MKKILIGLLVSVGLYADVVVDMYRDSGIGAVEAYIEKQLQSQSYWSEKLKNTDVRFGYYENLDTLLIANKSMKELSIYHYDRNRVGFLAKYEDIIVGRDGDKFKEGDLKTPLGVYRLKRRFRPSDQFYGSLAFSLSYPNTYDKVRGKDGHGIWIHGSPLDGSKREPTSKGCIVLDNDTIELLDKNVNHKSSIIIVSESGIERVKLSEVSAILAELFRWKSAWSRGDIESYLGFYSGDFRRYDGLKKGNFSLMKRRIFGKKEKKEIIFKRINISPYPNSNGKKLFKLSFYEIYRSKTYKFKGDKELFVELKGKRFSIISER